MRGTAFQPPLRVSTTLAACLAAALLISACSGPGFGRATSGSPQSTSSVNCRTLARQGVSVCPPTNPYLGSPRLVNHSNGLASRTQFKRYAQGLLRNLAYEQFALNTSQTSMYHLGLLATHHATNLVYSGDVDTISSAKKQGATLTNVPAALSEVKLVALSPTDQGYIREDGYTATSLAWIVTRTGPTYYFTTKGSTFSLPISLSSVPSYLVWGTYHGSTALGSIWTFDGSTSCTSDPVWQAVCNQ